MRIRKTFLTDITGTVHLTTKRHIFFGPGLNIRLQPEGDFAQLPLVQVPAALLGVQRPLLGLQQIPK